jgi:hypothetical protein
MIIGSIASSSSSSNQLVTGRHPEQTWTRADLQT